MADRKPRVRVPRALRLPKSARGIAWRVLNRVELDSAYADLALHPMLKESDLSRRDRAFATELAYGTLRNRGRLDCAISQVLDGELSKLEPGIRNLLRLGAYQVLQLSGVRDSAAVDECVNLAHEGGFSRASGLINAVLRKLTDSRATLVFAKLADDPVAWLRDSGSLPEWLAERWLHELGPQAAAALARVSLEAPPRTVRVSPGADLEAIAKRLGGKPCTYAPRGITDIRSDPVRDEAFERGELTIQDEASQLVVGLLGAEPGETVVDCCAAPGGKALQLAQIVGPRGEVIALELHEKRIPLIQREARRLGLRNVRALTRDVARGFDLQGRLRYPRILVDAPCTGLGVLRRNPDARWKVQADQIPKAAERQLSILTSAARYVERGGVLVYSVCTVTPEETHGVIDRFLEACPDFSIDDATPWLPEAAKSLVDEFGALRTWPHLHGCDGFYARRLVRA